MLRKFTKYLQTCEALTRIEPAFIWVDDDDYLHNILQNELHVSFNIQYTYVCYGNATCKKATGNH